MAPVLTFPGATRASRAAAANDSGDGSPPPPPPEDEEEHDAGEDGSPDDGQDSIPCVASAVASVRMLACTCTVHARTCHTTCKLKARMHIHHHDAPKSRLVRHVLDVSGTCAGHKLDAD